MFEKILEKVLLNNVGKFIDGIDKNNLKVGIWSGDIVIQNISVKPEVIDGLDLPIKMKYSFVGKLSVSVPWKTIGSRPVELLLEDVYVIIEPINQETWRNLDYNSPEKRLEFMEAFVKSFTAKIAEKQAQESKKEDQGMVGKITEKVIDNIQITVRNIHVRFENPFCKRKYAWGITLDEVLVYTTNNKWEKEYIDRTDAKNSLEPMRKMLSLKNLGFYWNAGVGELFNNLAPQDTKQKMKDLILKDQTPENQRSQYMLSISASCRLIQKNKKDPAAIQQPDFDVSLSLKPLDLELKKAQLEDVIHLLEYLNAFQRFKATALNEREAEAGKLEQSEKEKMIEEFKVLFGKLQRNEKAQDLKGEEKLKLAFGNSEEIERFKKLLASLPNEDLSGVIRDIVKDVEKERRSKAIEQQKIEAEKKNSSWFSWSAWKKDDLQGSSATKLDAQDLDEIDKYIQDAFGSSSDDTGAKLDQTAIQNLFHISFKLEGGTFYFSDVTSSGNEEGVALSYQGLSAEVDVNSKGQHVTFTLKDYSFFLKSRFMGAANYINMSVVRRLNHFLPVESTGNMISVVFDQNPVGKEEGTYIVLDSQAVEIVYRPVAIDRLVKFFDVSTQDEALKTQALDQLEKVQDKASQAAVEAAQTVGKKEIAITFAAPVVVIPFSQSAGIRSECWVVNLGDLFVNTKDEETKLYERYALGLKNLNFQYYPSQILFTKVSQSKKEKGDLSLLSREELDEYKRVFSLIENFYIDIGLDKMIAGMETKPAAQGRSQMDVNITIPLIDLKLNPYVYKNLLKTGEFINPAKGPVVEEVEEERTKLMVGNSKIGMVFVRETKIGNIVWSKYLCIFKGTHLHFFKNPTDQKPAFSYNIRGAEVIPRDDLEQPYAFVIENRQNTGYIACENEKLRGDWVNIISKRVKDYAAISTKVFDADKDSHKEPVEAPKTDNKPVDYNAVSMTLLFQIKEIKLAVFHREDSKLFDLETRNFMVDLKQQPGQMAVNLKLESIDITDYLAEYTNPSLRKFLTSVPTDAAVEKVDLVEIQVKTMEKTHPNYNILKTDLEVTTKLGYLFVNLKPLTIQETMKIFVPVPEQPKPTEKVEVKEIKAKTDETVYTQGTDNIMMKVNVELKGISVKLIHKTTKVCIAELALKNIVLFVIMKPLSMEVKGALGNIQLFDTTNYPHTIDSNIEYQKIRPYEMIGVGNKAENLIDLSFKSMDPRNPEADNVNRIYTYVDVKISSIRIDILMQPVLRVVDFLSGQLVPALGPDDGAAPKASSQVKTVVKLEKSVAETNLALPQFMDLKVFIKTPIIIIKPTPAATEYMEIRLGNLSLTNERIKDKARFKDPVKPLEFVYCERFNIKLSEMGMYRVQGESKLEMSIQINIDLSFEKPLFEEEYKLVYSEGQETKNTKFVLNNGARLEGHMTPFIIMLTHEDFLMIMKCLNFNIGYNDGMDYMFVAKSQAQETVEATQSEPGAPLNVSFVFENFTLLAFEKNRLPFAVVDLDLIKIAMSKDASQNTEINVSLRELTASYFENHEGSTLVQRKMLGAMYLNKTHKFTIANVPHAQVIKEIIKATSSQQEVNGMGTEEKEQFLVRVNMESNGDKVIKVTINEFKAHLITNIYLHLLEFLKMDDSVNPPQKAVPAVVQEDIKEVKKEEKPEEPQGHMTLSLELREILVTMPSTISGVKETPNVLALRGGISVGVENHPSPSLQESVIDVAKKNFTKAIDECADFNEVGRIKVGLEGLEMFVCEFEDLMGEKHFNQVKKRNMILPFSLRLVRKTHMVLNKERNGLMPITRNEISIERLIFRLSYQDAMLLNNTLQYQLQQVQVPEEEAKKKEEQEKKDKNEVQSVVPLKKKETFEESKTNSSSQLSNSTVMKIEKKENDSQDNWLADTDEFSIVSKGIQIVLINDAEGSLVPVLEFTIFELLVSMLKLPTKLRLGGKLVLNCSYFNPLPSKWEPFIERIGFDFALTVADSPKIDFALSTNEDYEDININISEQMVRILRIIIVYIDKVSILYSTSMTWKEGYEQTAHGKSSAVSVAQRAKEEYVIDYISPYIIVNNTGYPIEVEADQAGVAQQVASKSDKAPSQIKQKYVIEDGRSTQYLVESDIDKIFERSLQDIVINTNKIRVKVLHSSHDVSPVTGIDIEKASLTEYTLTGNLAEYKIFSVVKTDQSKKIITLTSSVRITNTLSVLIIVICEAANKKVEIRLGVNQTSAIPLDFIGGTVSIKLDNDGATQSSKVAIRELTKVNGTNMHEFISGNSFVYAKPVQVSPNFHEITLLPPYELKNCCGLELFYKIVDLKDTVLESSKLKPQEVLHQTKMSLTQPLFLQLRLQGYQWSTKALIHSPDPKAKLSRLIQVQDASENVLNIPVFIPEGEVGTRKVLLYTKTCIVNETPYDLVYHNVEFQGKTLIPGQAPEGQEAFSSRITLYNEMKSIAISRKNQQEVSKSVNVGTMGSTAVELVNESSTSLLDLGVNMSLLRCDRDHNLITKIITISPRFILLNKTNYPIQIKRDQGSSTLLTLEREVRTPLYWSEWAPQARDKSLCVRPVEANQDLWSWSNGFDIQAVGLYNFMVQSSDKTRRKFLKTVIELQASTIFITIQEEKPEQLAFKVCNTCAGVDIVLYQTDTDPANGVTVKPGQTIPWSWTYPNKKKEVSASFSVETVANYHTSSFRFSFDSLNTVSKAIIPITRDKRREILATVKVEGSSRVLRFFEQQKVSFNTMHTSFLMVYHHILHVKEEPLEVINLNVEIGIKGLGVSLITTLSTGKEKKIKERKEVLYLLLRDIEFRMVDSNKNKSSQVRIKYLNIDNNTSNETSFPVLLTPTRPKALVDRNTKSYFLDALVAQKVTPEITFFETVQFYLDASTLRVDGMFIDAMLEVANNFSNIFSSNSTLDEKASIAETLYHSLNQAKKLEDNKYLESKFEWKNKELSEFAGAHLYIKKLVLNALLFNISFQLKKKDAAEDMFFLLNLLTSALGTALANLDSAPLTLSGVVLENVFDSQEAIVKKIVDKYKNDVTKCIPKLLGSLDIVGNPVGLFSNISSGVVDLVEKPIEGFLQGPLEGGKGIVMGAGSLVKNTVSGTFNSIGKMTGSLASGLSNLTMDDEYMAQRERAKMKRPKHLGEGVYQGVTSIVKGVGEGVTGVFMKPLEGVSKGGFKGFFRGAFQGVTGLVVKPVTGMLDAAANTAEGIKNTATAFDQKPNEQKMRHPRPFYGKEKFYRTYVDTDAQIRWLLSSTEDQRHRDISLLSAFDVFPNEKEKDNFFILGISLEAIVCWDVKRNELKWVAELDNVEKVSQANNDIVIELKREAESIKDRRVSIKNCDPTQNAFIFKNLQEVLNANKKQ